MQLAQKKGSLPWAIWAEFRLEFICNFCPKNEVQMAHMDLIRTLNLIHLILLNQKMILQLYALSLTVLPCVLNASLNGSDDSLSAMSLWQLPVKGHSTWMLQFRPLTLVRSMQSLPCLTQGQQGCSLTPSLCDKIAWPCDH